MTSAPSAASRSAPPGRPRGPRRQRAASGPRARRRRPYWSASWRTRPTTGGSARSSPATGSIRGSAAAGWAWSIGRTICSLEREAALKLIAPDLAESSGFRERFSREARIAAALAHPNIVTVYDAGEVDGTLYLAMQYIEGSDLARMLAADGRLKPYRAIDVCRQVADALDAAHAAGLIHRDVKPANVLIEGRDAYLTDFGLTKRARRRDRRRSRRRRRGRARSTTSRPSRSKGAR